MNKFLIIMKEGRRGGDVKEYAEGARTEVSRKDLNGWGGSTQREGLSRWMG